MKGRVSRALSAVACAASAAVSTTAAAEMFTPVDLTPHLNGRLQDRQPAFPEGDVVLGGVPFHIPVGVNNEWRHAIHSYGTTLTVDVPVNVYGVTAAYTLINSDWGARTGGWMKVEFFGSDGAYAMRDLIGGSDLRDWNGWWTNTINGVTTVNVRTVPTGHDGDPDYLDMQIYALPPDFQDETLSLMRITDAGVEFTHSGILSGLTVIPEPAGLTLLLAGGLAVLVVRR
jgi:hypothetical protein